MTGEMRVDLSVAAGLAVAGLAGLAVGIEREWSGHATGPAARFAGVRTFLMLGLLGGLAGWLIEGGLLLPGALLLASGSLLTVAAYVMAARRGGAAVEGTTEVAALVVLALGAIAGLGFPLVTSAVASVMVLALVEKTRIHSTIERLGERELKAALQFAVLAVVILPLLPAGPFGPYDSIRPRAIWLVVLLFSGLNFAGYLISRWLGTSRGYGLTGLLGGLISSTAVTLQFSRRSRDMPAAGRALALGVVGACTVLVLRVEILAAALQSDVALALIRYLVPVLLAGAAVLLVLYLRRGRKSEREAADPARNPLGLWSAIRLAIAFQVVLLLVPLVRHLWGVKGILASAAVLGFTDVDALTYSMTRLGAEAAGLGAQAIAIGILSNTVLKLAVVLSLGRGQFRWIAGFGLVTLGVASGVGLWLGR
ncbi:MAG: MgtC/SapB family protein [Gemmatimonadales bacterium]